METDKKGKPSVKSKRCLLFSSTAVDSEDGVAIGAPGNLTLDTDFLLEQDIHFDDPDHDSKILSLEKFRGLLNTFFFSLSLSQIMFPFLIL